MATDYIGLEIHSVHGVELYSLDSGVDSDDINVVKRFDFSQGEMVEGGDDIDGHGTHITALAAAIDDIDGIVGAAPGAAVYSMKVVQDDGMAESAYIIMALEYIMNRRKANPGIPMVATISLGAISARPTISRWTMPWQLQRMRA